MSINHLNTSFTLPCGATIKNRLVKAAMTERLSNEQLQPTSAHHHIYERWADTDVGLQITGNVMVDPTYRESAGNVYIGNEDIIPFLETWSAIGKKNDGHIWPQISHPGRQTSRFLSNRPLAPSAVQLKKLGLFGKPKAMSSSDVEQTLEAFVKTASICKKGGFTGVQFHAAHGYLLSQFLSPLTNHRTDQWGGNLDNRSRLLRSIIDESRKVLGDDFPISIKLNSSDFQRGGFTEEESLEVIRMLDGKIDLLELSGGTYERLVFFEAKGDMSTVKESTKRREAYFIAFASKVREVSSVPLMITGGFRSFDFCNEVLANKELDLIGMARPFITDIEHMKNFLHGRYPKLSNPDIKTGVKMIDDASEGGYYARQLIRLAEGKELDSKVKPIKSALFFTSHEFKLSRKNKASNITSI